ncbi:N-acetylmuramic acid 6-phosphate etherase [Mesoplasma photuris]|uniref:N-acetylmuramic acid 6-phosphate etherase n=1 Tax=Mesoplasma photuris TaxID=217731 RepID=UPI0004E20E2F|nr:N-acetylmuramic acid 6-phosphate etherase [Mesoplasma photuris]
MNNINLTKIMTEQRNQNSRNLDQKTTVEILAIINSEDAKIADAINQQLPSIAKAVDIIVEAAQNNGRVFYLGAGSSGRIGVLDASEMLPTYGVDNLFYGLIAGGDKALRHPLEGAEDSKELAIEDLKAVNFTKNDIVLTIGASGRTPYCISAIEYAKEMGAKSVALCMTDNSEFEKKADVCIAILSGPEVVTGSTRMKSGTATKMVLNMISTTTMIKLGKVYDNLMIDVKATNEKLVSRCINIVKELTGETDSDKVLKTLKLADMDVKIATLSLVKNIDIENAKKLLTTNNQSLRLALA